MGTNICTINWGYFGRFFKFFLDIFRSKLKWSIFFLLKGRDMLADPGKKANMQFLPVMAQWQPFM